MAGAGAALGASGVADTPLGVRRGTAAPAAGCACSAGPGAGRGAGAPAVAGARFNCRATAGVTPAVVAVGWTAGPRTGWIWASACAGTGWTRLATPCDPVIAVAGTTVVAPRLTSGVAGRGALLVMFVMLVTFVTLVTLTLRI